MTKIFFKEKLLILTKAGNILYWPVKLYMICIHCLKIISNLNDVHGCSTVSNPVRFQSSVLSLLKYESTGPGTRKVINT